MAPGGKKGKRGKGKEKRGEEGLDEDELFESLMAGSIDFGHAFKEGETVHAPDAVDFEDEDELADEELPEEEEPSGRVDGGDGGDMEDEEDEMDEFEQEGLAIDLDEVDFDLKTDLFNNAELSTLDADELLDDQDLLDLDLELDQISPEQLKLNKELELQRVLLEKAKREERLLKLFYPDFRPGVVMKMIPTFSSLEYGDYSWYHPPAPSKPLIPTKLEFEVDVDERKLFARPATKSSAWKLLQKTSTNTAQRVIPITESDLKTLIPTPPQVSFEKPSIEDFDGDLVLATCDWDDDLIMGAGASDSEDASTSLLPPSKKFKIDPYGVDDWIDDDEIFEGQINVQSLNLKLDTNDPHILFFDNPEPKTQNSKASIPTNSVLFASKFDISNDKEYDALRSNYHSKVRSTIGDLSIEHAQPATRLQFPYYKIKLTTKQIRMLHRPQIHIKLNSVWNFTKVKKRKSKKDKGKTVQEIFSKSTDLTLGDSGNFFMMEYIEEIPLALSNFGMASKLINYYRKRSDDDPTRPRLTVGETRVLGVQDKSPFWNFGFVEPGNVVPTLYNKMVRAPIFKQEPKETDFLIIRSSGGPSNITRYYVRPITHLFTVGQQLPAVEIPGPHSRKVTSTSKNRLKMIVYRCLNKNENLRLAVKDISDHFPDQNDMQNRQRLKEFMEYQRVGDDHGFWKVKKGDILPNFEQIRSMITPEDISLLESMTSGDQYLNDLAYYYGDEEEQEKQKQRNKEKSNYNNKNIGEESIEEQLAPWNITRNFLTAVQGKAMLQIHGEGDPTGRGEAFSFLRTSMKGGFKSSGDDDYGSALMQGASPMDMKEKKRGRKKDEDKSKMQPSHKYNVAVQQRLYDDEIAKVWYSQQRALTDDGEHKDSDKVSDRIREIGSSELADDIREATPIHIRNPDSNIPKPRKFLKITRMVRDSNGMIQRKTEIIKDSAVIKAYVERKIRLQINSGLDSDVLGPTGDAEQNERMKKALMEEIERLEKSKERRKKKGPHKKKNVDGTPLAPKKTTNRRCKKCGSTGHISTNKKLCPLYNKDVSTELSTPMDSGLTSV